MIPTPIKGSINGEHGFPKLINPSNVRVLVDGDMPRGVVAYDIVAGWAEVIIFDDEGRPLHDGVNLITQRIYGHVEVKRA